MWVGERKVVCLVPLHQIFTVLEFTNERKFHERGCIAIIKSFQSSFGAAVAVAAAYWYVDDCYQTYILMHAGLYVFLRLFKGVCGLGLKPKPFSKGSVASSAECFQYWEAMIHFQPEAYVYMFTSTHTPFVAYN